LRTHPYKVNYKINYYYFFILHAGQTRNCMINGLLGDEILKHGTPADKTDKTQRVAGLATEGEEAGEWMRAATSC